MWKTRSEREGHGLTTRVSRKSVDILAAQRLRYRVFAQELGAKVEGAAFGIDRDAYDEHCDHLLVCDEATREVVGTYRMLPAPRAAQAGGFYSATEFELGAIGALPRSVEVGRACVEPRYRTGAVLALLWSGLANYLRGEGFEFAFGCASVPAREPSGDVVRLCGRLFTEFSSPIEWRVTPRRPLDGGGQTPGLGDPLEPPPLLRGYLAMGAFVCGPPAWDPGFGTADLLVLLPLARLRDRFARRLLRAA